MCRIGTVDRGKSETAQSTGGLHQSHERKTHESLYSHQRGDLLTFVSPTRS